MSLALQINELYNELSQKIDEQAELIEQISDAVAGRIIISPSATSSNYTPVDEE